MAQGVTVDFNANIARFTSALDRATNDLNKFQSNASRIGQNLNRVFLAFGASLSAGAIVYGLKQTINSFDAISKSAQKLSTSTEELSKLQYAAKLTGLESERLESGMAKLAKAAYDAATTGGTTADAFKQLGVEVKGTDGKIKDTSGLLIEIADRMSKINDPAAKAGVVMTLFGSKIGKDLIPFLNLGKEGLKAYGDELERLGGVIDTKAAQQAEQFNDNLEKLSISAKDLGRILVSEMLPGLTQMTEQMVEGAKQAGILGAAWAGLKEVLKLPFGFADNLPGIADETQIRNVEGTIKELQDRIESLRAQLGKHATSEGSWIGNFLYGDPRAINAEIAMLNNQIEVLKKHGAEIDALTGRKPKALPAPGGSIDLTTKGNTAPQEFIGDSSKAERLDSLAGMLAEERAMFDRAQRDQVQMWNDLADPTAEYKRQIEEVKTAMAAGLISEEVGNKNIDRLNRLVKDTEDAAKKMNKTWEQFTINVQRNLGDVLYDGLNGKFTDIGDAFKQMLLRMAADAAAAKITESLFGSASFLGTFFGGGKAAGGPVMGGVPYLVGEQGPELFVPRGSGSIVPNGKMGISIVDNTVINVDSRADRAQVISDISMVIDNKQSMLVDRLRREGALA